MEAAEEARQHERRLEFERRCGCNRGGGGAALESRRRSYFPLAGRRKDGRPEATEAETAATNRREDQDLMSARARRIPVSGEENPDRVLTLRFDRFVDEMLATPEPRSRDDLERLGEGADFLLDLTGGGMPDDLAGAILALSDDAFDQAHRILAHEAYYEPPDHYYADPEGRRLGPLLRLTDHLRDEATFAGIRDGLLNAEPAEDPSVALAGELL